jgi:hypothetical protein
MRIKMINPTYCQSKVFYIKWQYSNQYRDEQIEKDTKKMSIKQKASKRFKGINIKEFEGQ